MAKKRLTAFWNREIVDRCCLSVKCIDPAAAAKLEALQPADRIRERTDSEWIIRKKRIQMEHTYCGGESFLRFL